MLFIGDRYFEDDMEKYAGQIDAIWEELSTLHGFWRRYAKFFNVHRVDLVSPLANPEDYKDVSNSALGIDLRLDRPFSQLKDSRIIRSVLNELELKADTRIILMGREYGGGWAFINGDLCYAHPKAPIVAHELGHSMGGLWDEYLTSSGPTRGKPNMAKSHEEAKRKWGHWYGYVDPDTGLAVGKLQDGEWVPHMNDGDDYYRASPHSTLMRVSGANRHFDAVARETLILDLYKHVRPLDSYTDNTDSIRPDQVLEASVVDSEVIQLEWSVEDYVVGQGPRLDLSSVHVGHGDTVRLLAYDTTLNTDYDVEDRGGWVRRDTSGRLTQSVTWHVVVPGVEDNATDPKVVYVDDDATAGGYGTSWANAHKYLQDALTSVDSGHEIWVAEGTYKPDQGAGKTAGDRTASFSLVNGVGIYGGFKGTETTRTPLGDGNQTILSGEINADKSLWSIHVVMGGKGLDASTVMDGFRITKGNANGTGSEYARGGGMYLEVWVNNSLTLTNCVFTGNSAKYGGGICNYRFSPSLTNCVFTNNTASHGGGMYNTTASSPSLTNCVFTNNTASHGGGMYNTFASSPSLTNCVFSSNSAGGNGGGMSNPGIHTNTSFSTLTNCVFINNTAMGKGGGISDESDGGTFVNTIFHQNTSGSGHADLNYEAIPGVPLSKVSYCLVSGGYSGTGNADGSPLFVNADDPDGPDDKWFTEDDGLRLKEGSTGIDAGNLAGLTADTSDLDKDGNTAEPLPIDATGFRRVQGRTIDLGPYEYGESKSPAHKISLFSHPRRGGRLTGEGHVEDGKSTTISATAKPGYLFTGWSGNAAGTINPLTITVDATKSITANFAQDLSDGDGDGLSNYAELVTHGTKANDNDTDDDGLLDNEEIQLGTDPKSSDATLINFLKAKTSPDETSVRANAQAEGRTTGITAVKDDPSAYNLVTKAAYDQMVEQLINSSDSGSTTPYTDGWLYYPNRGWMWTDRTSYPYFYDSSTKAWMYFRSGEDKPRFYHYGTKTWVTLGE